MLHTGITPPPNIRERSLPIFQPRGGEGRGMQNRRHETNGKRSTRKTFVTEGSSEIARRRRRQGHQRQQHRVETATTATRGSLSLTLQRRRRWRHCHRFDAECDPKNKTRPSPLLSPPQPPPPWSYLTTPASDLCPSFNLGAEGGRGRWAGWRSRKGWRRHKSSAIQKGAT
ncbi:unnamed protein product, partial [Ectocarpus fasciculatus]